MIKKGVRFISLAVDAKRYFFFSIVVMLIIISLNALGDSAAYNLTFSNSSKLNLTVNISQNATYVISITNNNDSNRSYNLSAIYGVLNTSQINLTGYNSTNVTLDVWNSSNMTIFTYVHAVLSNDSSIVLNSSEDMGVIKTTILDNLPPQLSNISNYSITNQSAIVSWNANENANGTVIYGTSAGNRSLNCSNSAFSSFIQITILNLTSNTTYFYVINASDPSGNQNQSEEFNFTTTPTYAHPVINSVNLSDNITQNNTPVVITVNVSKGDFPISNVTADGFNLTNQTDPNATTSLWNGTINLTAGNSPIEILVYDENSLNATYSTSYAIDDTAPQIIITYPQAGWNISATNITITYTITEAYLLNGTFYHNGTLSGTLNTTSGEFNITVVPGLNQNITISALDEANNSNTSTVNFSIDTTPPNASADYNRNAWVNYTVIVNFTGEDPGISTGIRDFFYCIGQDEFNCTNFSAGNQSNISTEGNNTLRYFSQDFAGNNGTIENLSVLVDKTYPIIELAPIDWYNATTNSVSDTWGLINFSWNITEDNLWIANRSLNGTHLGDINLSHYNATNVTEGLNQNVTYGVCDLAGNCISRVRYFQVDRLPPNITINWNNTGTWLNNTNIVINATAIDNAGGTGIQEIEACAGLGICVLAETTIGSNNTAYFTISPAKVEEEGNLTVRFRTTDYSGQESTIASTTVLIDWTSPVINLSLPVNNSNISAHNLSFVWNTAEINLKNLTYSVNESLRSNISASGIFTDLNITQGLNQTLSLNALDLAGNSNTTQVTFHVDWYAPISESNFSNITAFVNYTIPINLTANETNGVGVENFYYCIGDSNCEPNSTGSFINITDDGINYVRFYAVDYAGNNESSMNLNNESHTQVAYVDRTGPSITTDYLSVWRNAPVDITLTSTDPYSGPNKTVYLLEGSTLAEVNFSANQTANITTISVNQSGNYTLEFFGYDNLQNKASNKSVYILFDNQTPNATINSLPQFSKGTFNVSYNATDFNLSGIDRVYVHYKLADVNTSEYTIIGSGTSSPIEVTLSSDANYSLKVTAKDKARNNQSINATLSANTTIDTTLPSLNISYPVNHTTIGSSSINITWVIEESNLANLTYRLDFGEYTANTSSGYQQLSNLSSGFHQVILSAQDLAGNSIIKSANFTVSTALNVSAFLADLDTYNVDAFGFSMSDANDSSLTYTGNESLDLTNITIDLVFWVNYSDVPNTSNSVVAIQGFPATQATYSSLIRITADNLALNNSLSLAGYRPLVLLSVHNMSAFLANENAYYANATFNITNLTFDYVHYCTGNDASACSLVYNCSQNSYSNGEAPCYTIGPDWMSVYLNSFSSVVLSRDEGLSSVSITSPSNTTNLTTGSLVYLTFTTGEQIYGNYSFDSQGNTSIPLTSSFSGLLNGTLLPNYSILENGEHNVTLWLSDLDSNSDIVYLDFNVSDYYAPQINSVTVSGNSTTSPTGTAIVQVETNEYTRCWYAQGDNTLVASVSDLSAYEQASGGHFATVHNITHTYTRSGVVQEYYVTCQDALGNNMSTNANSDYFYTYVDYTAPLVNSGGGGGGSPRRQVDEAFVPPDNWGLYNDLYWELLEMETPAARQVRVDRVAIRNITLSVILPQNHVSIRVVELKKLPQNIPVIANTWDDRPVYQYLSLIEQNLTSEVLRRADFEFRVSKFWIRNNQVNASSIKLYRFHNFQWQELPTRIAGTTEDFTYYTSQSPGLSYFAVVGTETFTEKLKPKDDNELDKAPAQENKSQSVDVFNYTSSTENTTDEPKQAKKEGSLLWIYITVSVVTFLVIMYAVLFKYYKWQKRYF